MHDVQIDVLEARLPGGPHRSPDVLHRVYAAERFQRGPAETLRSDRQPVDAGPSIARRVAGLDGARVGFHAYFDVFRKTEARGDGVEQPGNVARREKARCAATQKYADEFAPRNPLRLARDVLDKRIEIAIVVGVFACRKRIEVAVGTLLHAPRQVYVQGQWWRKPCHQSSRSSLASSFSASPR